MMKPIVQAVFNNHTEKLQELLKSGDPNDVDEQQRSLLAIAVFREHKTCLRILLEHGANPNSADAMSYGARAKDPEYLKLLFEFGANPNNKLPHLPSPLITAIEHGNNEVFRALVDAGANLTEAESGESPLAHAAGVGNMPALAYLLKRAHVSDGEVTKAIRQASIKGHSECLRTLLPLSDIREQDHLRFAVWNRRLDAARLLLESGANPNLEDQDGYSPLWHTKNHTATNLKRCILSGGTPLPLPVLD